MTTRPTLPQNNIRDQGTLLEAFGNTADWTAVNAGTFAADTTNYKVGTQGIRMTPTTPAGSAVYSRTISALDLSSVKSITIWVYLHSALADISDMSFALAADAGLTRMMIAVLRPLIIYAGWNRITIAPSAMTASGGGLPSDTMIRARLRIGGAADKMPSITFGAVYYNQTVEPRCLFTFDDPKTTSYTVAKAYMDAKGIVGTVFVVPTVLGTEGYWTLAQCQEAYANGWAISNHAYDHANLTELSQAACQANLEACRDYLIANGMPRAANYMAHPGGQRNATVDAAAVAAGVIIARSVRVGSVDPFRYSAYDFPVTKALTTGTTLASCKAAIDTAITTGTTIVFMGHMFAEEAAAETWVTADFQALIDYAVQRKIKCVTIDEFDKGLTNPRYRSLPLTRA